jgi:DNA polymerase-4
LEKAGIRTIADLRRWDRVDLIARFGSMGDRLWHLSRGVDTRKVSRNEPVKSISKETTFNEDIADKELLKGHLWRLAEQVSDRAKAQEFAGRTVTLKLKSTDFASVTRRHSLASPTQTADRIYREAESLLESFKEPGSFRLIGVGISDLCPESQADSIGDLLDPDAGRRAAVETATDKIRARFGRDAIIKGRALR